jgi:hypothetical protein
LDHFPLQFSEQLFNGLAQDLNWFVHKQRSIVPYDLTAEEALQIKDTVQQCERSLAAIASLYKTDGD